MMAESKLVYLKTPLKYCPVIRIKHISLSLKTNKQTKKPHYLLSKAPVPPKMHNCICVCSSSHMLQKQISSSLCLGLSASPLFPPETANQRIPKSCTPALHATPPSLFQLPFLSLRPCGYSCPASTGSVSHPSATLALVEPYKYWRCSHLWLHLSGMQMGVVRTWGEHGDNLSETCHCQHQLQGETKELECSHGEHRLWSRIACLYHAYQRWEPMWLNLPLLSFIICKIKIRIVPPSLSEDYVHQSI